ncbi:phospholipase A2 inhibitor and Ly6/PLAUR domain-containing protein-like [Chrysemys picta bellii]|uniref:phospholipase A2 inhibitor and Ly6/PLAUR domain-containing protein-like n=1 Tax=Chrysemys picta bellii TaxID=8478 RepID=UPI0032B27ABC
MPAPRVLCLLAALLAAAEAQTTAKINGGKVEKASVPSPALSTPTDLLSGGLAGPIINTVYTGGRCPICFAPGRSSCSSKETLQCEGRASQCISISGQISEDDITIPFAAKGCATPHACELTKGEILDSGVFTYKITQTECYTPSGAQRMLGPFGLGSILPSLAGLLAVKFLS